MSLTRRFDILQSVVFRPGGRNSKTQKAAAEEAAAEVAWAAEEAAARLNAEEEDHVAAHELMVAPAIDNFVDGDVVEQDNVVIAGEEEIDSDDDLEEDLEA